MAALIIDPDPKTRDLAGELIKRADGRISVEGAKDGHVALMMARGWCPDLIICEQNLPDISGVALCERLHGFLPQAMFIAYSQSEPPQSDIFDGFLSKPPSRYHMDAIVKAAKGRKRESNRSSKKASAPAGNDAQKPPQRNLGLFVSVEGSEELKFSVPVFEGSTLASAFEQIGKTPALFRNVFREGIALTTEFETTKLVEGDLIIVGG